MLKLAFAGAVIGIAGLFIFSLALDYEEHSIQDIVEKQLQGTFKTTAYIEEARSTNATTFLKLSQQCEVDAVLFLPTELKEGMRIEAIGEKQGEELVIRRLRVLNASTAS
ncbi:MAG: hypothetical protein Q7S65_01570 [Nanoarchaeota archaeon]|nr:hypothetical protein [Nanoarchaeota archaeon]